MAKKLEKINNYLVITDTGSSNVDFELPAKDVRYINDSGNVTFLFKDEHPIQRESYPLGLTAATGTVTLTGGASGSVNGITVNSIQIMSGAENFATDLATTAANVAANITAFTSTPNYTATSDGAVITITSVTLGAGVNGFAVVSSATTITTSDVNMAGATSNLLKTGDVAFDDEADLLTFLRTNTGA